MRHSIHHFRSQGFYPVTTAQNCMRHLEHTVSFTYIVWYARLCLQILPGWLASVFFLSHHHLNTVFRVPAHILDSRLVDKPCQICIGVPFVPPQPSLVLVMNMSALSWEAHPDFLQSQGLGPQNTRLFT